MSVRAVTPLGPAPGYVHRGRRVSPRQAPVMHCAQCGRALRGVRDMVSVVNGSAVCADRLGCKHRRGGKA